MPGTRGQRGRSPAWSWSGGSVWGGVGCRAGGLQREVASRQRCQHLFPAVEVFVSGDDEERLLVSRTLLGCKIPCL